MNGLVQIYNNRNIPGPYVQSAREHWLRRVLEAQVWVRKNGPHNVSDIELITLDELCEIRRIWLTEKHEFEDTLPRIYEDVVGQPFPKNTDDNLVFGFEEVELLKEFCGDDRLQFELLRELLDIEQRLQTQSRRAGLYDALERALQRNSYQDAEQATTLALRRKKTLEAAKTGEFLELPFALAEDEIATESA
jgi:DNA sulfur modification protein DndC